MNDKEIPESNVSKKYFPHSASQKRIYGDYIYFITCGVDDRIPIFQETIFCDLWIQELRLCKDIFQFKLCAFCLNYEHFHVMLKPNNHFANYSEIMLFLKRNFSYDVNKIMGFTNFDNAGKVPIHRQNTDDDVPIRRQNTGDDVPIRRPNNESDVPIRRPNEHKIQASDSWERRLREHKIYLDKMRDNFLHKYGVNHHFPKFKWQKSFHDHIIRNQNDFDNHWNYTMYNFRKHGLPEDWQYTGLNYSEMLDEME